MFEIRESSINNVGVFATENIPKDRVIGVWCTKKAEIGKKIRSLYNPGMIKPWYETEILGRYCNHSFTPNTYINNDGTDLILFSNEIFQNDEILVNYIWVQEQTGYIVNLSPFGYPPPTPTI